MSLGAEAVELYSETPIASPSLVIVLFAIPRSKASKLIVPVGDIDNYQKAIFDLLQARQYLADDKWITTVTAKKRFLPAGTVGYTLISLMDEPEEIDI